jgi:hypothetical protein
MDIGAAVAFAARGNVLELLDLRDVAKTLSVLQTLKGFVELRAGAGMSQLAAYAEGIDLPPELVELLTDAFDEEGCVRMLFRVCLDARLID